MSISRKRFYKLILFIIPIASIFFFIYLFENFVVIPNTIDDSDLGSRKFILGLYAFAAIIIMINLIHLQVYLENKKIKIEYQLSHRLSEDRNQHELFVRGKFICPGCVGSFFALLLGNSVLFLYLIDLVKFSPSIGLILGMSSIILIYGGYSRYLIEFSPRIRIFQHFSLFLGLIFLVIALDAVYNSFYLIIFSVPLLIGFILIRMILAKINEDK